MSVPPVRDTWSRPRADALLPHGTRMHLAAEHAVLLRQAASLVDDLLHQTAAGRWPAAELQLLIGCLETAVPGHALQWPGEMTARGITPELTLLVRSRDRLRTGIALLALTAAGPGPRSAGQLAVLARDLLCLLERHFTAEESLRCQAGVGVPVHGGLPGRRDPAPGVQRGAVGSPRDGA